MTWLKLDDRFHRNRKVAPLSDRAWRLHVTALLECCAQLTDGFVERSLPPTWPQAPRGKALSKTVAELEAAGLWDPCENGWLMHDFLDWNPSAEKVKTTKEARVRAGQTGGKQSGKVRAKTKQNGKQMLEQNGSKNEAKTNPVPVPVPEINPPSPPLADPFALPRDRADVQELHEAWKQATGLTGHSIRNTRGYEDSKTLAEAIDTHGLAVCLLVAKHAHADGMVSGREDERKQKHESIQYIFGNGTTFARILRDAKKSDGAPNMSEIARRARAL